MQQCKRYSHFFLLPRAAPGRERGQRTGAGIDDDDAGKAGSQP